MKLDGIYAPIPTPFVGDRIAWRQLEDNLEHWARTSLNGLVVLGSNGEFPYLDANERVAMVSFVRQHFPSDRPVVAGTGCESTRATIQLTEQCADAGADAALVITPSYYKSGMNDEALLTHYTTVADASPIPVVLYNMPRNTGVNLSAEAVVRLSHHPGIIGIKDSSGDIAQVADMAARCASGFCVFCGSGSFLFPALAVGATGGTLAVACIMPEQCTDIVVRYRAGQAEEACRMQASLLEANAAVTVRWGVAGLKAALDMLGFFGGETRRPLLPLGEAAREQLKDILCRTGLIS